MPDVVVTGGGEPIPAPKDNSPITIHEAIELRRPKEQTEQAEEPVSRQRAPDGKFARQEESASPSEADAAAPTEEPPGETEAPDPAEPEAEPSIEPPKSWTKEEKEAFRNFSPEHQKTFLEREQKREKDIRSRLKEAAEQSKQVQAEALAHQQARQKYETALPQIVSALNAAHLDKFGDIKTQADLDRLAQEDVIRWVEYSNSRQKVAAVQAQAHAAERARAAQQAQQWEKWSAEQDAKFVEAHPADFSDLEKSREQINKAARFLNDIGFTDGEMKAAMSGVPVSMRDARIQTLIYKAMKYDAAQADVGKAKAQPPAPKVQRPGSGRSAGVDTLARAQAYENQISQAATTNDQIRAAIMARKAYRSASQKG